MRYVNLIICLVIYLIMSIGLVGCGGGTTTGATAAVKPGEVLSQVVNVTSGEPLRLNYGFSTAAQSRAMRALAGNKSAAGNLELVVANPEGIEVAYQRLDLSDTSVTFTPKESGNFTVLLRNNTDSNLTAPSASVTGANSYEDVVLANESKAATFANISLKAFVGLSRNCKDNDGARTVAAPSGSVYVQPFVFMGKVNADKTVTDIGSASIKVVSGATEIALKSLAEIDPESYRDVGLPWNPDNNATLLANFYDQLRESTKRFYQGYLGGAGEMYSTETFSYWGTNTCDSAQTIALGTDPGAADIKLVIVENSLGINLEFPLRATVAPAFTVYTAAAQRLTDYTLCSYHRATGTPAPWDEGESCLNFSLGNLPYVSLDYLLPSEENGAYSFLSNPSRIAFYGHSFNKQYYTELAAHSSELASGATSEITIDGCLNNGGLSGVPLNREATYLPLKEMSTKVGDVINLAYRPASYTALVPFYQGNVDLSGAVTYDMCVAYDDNNSCIAGFGDYNTTTGAPNPTTVHMVGCTGRADSGVSVGAVSDSFIYPSYFSMSGEIIE